MKFWLKFTLLIVIILVIFITIGIFLFIKFINNSQLLLQYKGSKSPLKKNLDFSPFEESISSMKDNKYKELDTILEKATIEEIKKT